MKTKILITLLLCISMVTTSFAGAMPQTELSEMTDENVIEHPIAEDESTESTQDESAAITDGEITGTLQEVEQDAEITDEATVQESLAEKFESTNNSEPTNAEQSKTESGDNVEQSENQSENQSPDGADNSEKTNMTQTPYVKTISVTEDSETGEIITIKEYSDISLVPEYDESETSVRDVVAAENTSRSADDDIYISTYAQTYANKVDAAYTAIQSDAYVDTQTGSMAANVTDLYIPGKNGFDIRLDRTFNTKSSPMNEYYTKYYDEKFEMPKAYGYKYLCTTNNKEVYIYFYNEEELFRALPSFRGNLYDSDEINYYGSIHNDTGSYEYVKVNDGTVREVLSSTFAVGSSIPYARNEEYINIGYGWRLQVPFAAEYARIYDDGTYTHKYLLQTRKCETVSFEFNTYRNSDGDRIASAINGKSDSGYKFTMLDKDDPEKTTTHPAGFEYNITATSNDGDTYYCLWSYSEKIQVVAITDRYNNIIRINMSENLCIITDSYGVVYECSNNGIKRIANNVTTELVKYEWQTINADFDINDEYSLDDEYIFTVTRNSGTSNTISQDEPDKTQYYIKQKLMYNRMLRVGPWLIYRLPYKVVTPTGLTKYFEYTKYNNWKIGYPNDTVNGYYYYVTDYHETSSDGSDIKNHKVYTYSFNTGGHKYYVEQSVQKTYVGDTILNTNTVTYNKSGFVLTEKISSGSRYKQNSYTYANGYPLGRVATHEINIQGRTHTIKYTYNKDKLASETNGDYVCTNTYYEDNYYLPHTTAYTKDADTAVKIEYLLTEDGKSIATKNVYENGVLQSTENYTYDSTGILTSVSIPREDGTNAVTSYSYVYSGDGGYTLTSTQSGMVDADGTVLSDITTSQTVDWQGNVISATDANGNTTTTTYDLLNRPLTITYPDTSVETYTYDISNNISTLVTESEAKYYAAFDDWGNRIKYERSSDGASSKELIESASYDELGQLKDYKRYYSDTEYTQVSYTYDYQHRLKTEKVYNNIGTLLKTTEYVYMISRDSNSRPLQHVVRNVSGDAGTYASYTEKFDYMGNVVEANQTSGDEQRIYTYTYDYVGNMLSETDPKGSTTTYTYDYANRPLTVTNAADGTKTYTYNSLGLVNTESDYMNNTASYTYDNAGRVLTVTSPFDESGNGFTKNYYDPNGNITRTMVKSNYATDDETTYNITDYGYDNMNRIAYSAVYPTAESPIYTNYTYSTDGMNMSITSGNNSTSAANKSADAATTNYSYDIYGNLIAISSEGLLYGYTYDNQGRVTYIDKTNYSTMTDCKSTQYTYDDFDNVLTRQSTSTLNPDSSVNVSYTYNILGQRLSMTDGSGTTAYTYNPFGELTQESKGSIIKAYTYDAVSNRTGFTLTTDGVQQINSTYTYDALCRLTGYTSNGYSTAYTYDANSNIITATKPDGSVETNTYNLAGMLLTTFRTDATGELADRYYYQYYYNGKLYSNKNFYKDLIFNRYKYDGAGRLSMDFAMSDTDDFKDMYTYDSRGNITV